MLFENFWGTNIGRKIFGDKKQNFKYLQGPEIYLTVVENIEIKICCHVVKSTWILSFISSQTSYVELIEQPKRI
jgi:hypothetical protein